MSARRFAARFEDTWLVAGARTPFVDYCGAFGALSPTDMGIKAAREAIARAGIPADRIESVIAGSMAQAATDAYLLPRHIGLYSGVPQRVPALLVQRICGTGFEVFRQAADQFALGYADTALVVGTESMTRNPIAAYTHRTGFKLGAPVAFEDFLWEALDDPAAAVSMIETAENLAQRYRLTRAEVDEFAALSHARALDAQARGVFNAEIAPVVSEVFELSGYRERGIDLPRRTTVVDTDTHPRHSPIDALSRLSTVYPGGVQTAGNSSGLVDGAAAAVLARSSSLHGQGVSAPLARIAGAAAAGVPPEIMGIGPVAAIRDLLAHCELRIEDIDLFEINEAQGAQIVAVERELGLDRDKLNIHGGAIALGHPLAATGVRLTLTLAHSLQRLGLRWGVASACIGGGQGMALLLENPQA